MSFDVLKIIGQVAGIGGLSLGVLLILFKDIIKKNIFPSLKRDHAYSIIKLMLILVWSIAFLGILGWVFLEYHDKTLDKQENVINNNLINKVNVSNKDLVSVVGDCNPVISDVGGDVKISYGSSGSGC